MIYLGLEIISRETEPVQCHPVHDGAFETGTVLGQVLTGTCFCQSACFFFLSLPDQDYEMHHSICVESPIETNLFNNSNRVL